MLCSHVGYEPCLSRITFLSSCLRLLVKVEDIYLKFFGHILNMNPLYQVTSLPSCLCLLVKVDVYRKCFVYM